MSRTAFLLESLKDLDEQLRDKGSRLFVAQGKPEEILPDLFKEWGVKKLTFEADSEPRSLQRDRDVRRVSGAPKLIVGFPRGRVSGRRGGFLSIDSCFYVTEFLVISSRPSA